MTNPVIPNPGSQGTAPPRNGLGVAALVLGIVGIVISWMPLISIGAFISSILAIIFGALGAKRARTGQATNRAVALWGMWLGIVAMILWVIFFLIIGILLASSSNSGM